MSQRYEDLAGKRYGILTAVSYQGRAGNNAAWLVRCDCGTEKTVKSTNLKRSKSCGCLTAGMISVRNRTHGLTTNGKRHALFDTWSGMIQRCYSMTSPSYPGYGGRGIAVCDRWLNGQAGLTAFECFLADMGPRPARHSLDRIDNDGNYEPSNCRWAEIKTQQRNRRSNHKVTFRGKEMTMTEAIELSGLNEATVWGRLKLGWSETDALERPLRGSTR